jgi:ATP-dependent Lhr-like helicase
MADDPAEMGFAAQIEATQAVRRRLRRAWAPFFGRFGRLLPIQIEAIPAILDGRDAVLSAPTASGKTEAALAPLAERMAADSRERDMGVIYIVPTRALANDMAARIQGPLRELGLELKLRTGDQRQLQEGNRADVVLTTPESLDSIASRQRRSWDGLVAFVLDELHLIDGSVRGDQLRVLIRRIETERGCPVQTIGLSATLADPAGTASRYMRDPAVLTATGGRPFRLDLVRTLGEAVEILRRDKLHKALVFANTRSDVEDTAGHLEQGLWPKDRVFVHHGSLARSQRLDVERALREQRWGIAVATTTLELGVDIGDIDAVVLFGLPRSRDAMLQRIGRSNRREGLIRAIGVAHTEEDMAKFTAMAEAARDGALDPIAYAPDLSVVVQQTLSLLYQHRAGLTLDTLSALMAPIARPDVTGEIVHHMRDKGRLALRGNRFQLTEETLAMGDKGKIHSNLIDRRGMPVIDARSDIEIGRGAEAWIVDQHIQIAGRVWRVTEITDDAIYVLPAPPGSGRSRFIPNLDGGAFTSWLPEAMRERSAP